MKLTKEQQARVEENLGWYIGFWGTSSRGDPRWEAILGKTCSRWGALACARRQLLTRAGRSLHTPIG